MPRIYDPRTGRDLGLLSEQDYTRLMAMMAPPCDQVPPPGPLDPSVVEQLVDEASPPLRAVICAILDGCEDFEVEWEPDPD